MGSATVRPYLIWTRSALDRDRSSMNPHLRSFPQRLQFSKTSEPESRPEVPAIAPETFIANGNFPEFASLIELPGNAGLEFIDRCLQDARDEAILQNWDPAPHLYPRVIMLTAAQYISQRFRQIAVNTSYSTVAARGEKQLQLEDAIASLPSHLWNAEHYGRKLNDLAAKAATIAF